MLGHRSLCPRDLAATALHPGQLARLKKQASVLLAPLDMAPAPQKLAGIQLNLPFLRPCALGAEGPPLAAAPPSFLFSRTAEPSGAAGTEALSQCLQVATKPLIALNCMPCNNYMLAAVHRRAPGLLLYSVLISVHAQAGYNDAGQSATQPLPRLGRGSSTPPESRASL